MSDNHIYQLFWTGGWDSTYRLLEIVTKNKEKVQLIYIKDLQRKSLNKEIEVINKILNKIYESYPYTKELILPIKIFCRENITISEKVNKSYLSIKNFTNIGSQYEWLAALCENENLKNVELCIFKNERTDLLFRLSQDRFDNIEEYEELKNAIKTLYENFQFPILNINKIDIFHESKKNNWLDIMKMTWFCHKPKNGNPCGKCNPCMITISEGLGYRIPLSNRIKGIIKLSIKRFK